MTRPARPRTPTRTLHATCSSPPTFEPRSESSRIQGGALSSFPGWVHDESMCGRFALNSETNELIEEYVAQGGDYRDWAPDWNIKPTNTVPIVVESAKGADHPVRRLEGARWSLIPPWSKTLTSKFPTFNARSEGITEKATWKGPVKSKRALIPASGYYEWHTVGKTKTPHYIHPRAGELISFAGLYSWWKDPTKADDDDTRWVLTATILTMPAVPSLAEIHDRTPVTLPKDWWDDWLSPELVGDQAFVDAAVAASIPVADALAHHEVAPLRGEGAELIAPLNSL